ncbi:MAG: hypothetical protein GXO03_02580 [Aquificae bacterium]|nr:hypothetical protein [Aquificota bacterium]
MTKKHRLIFLLTLTVGLALFYLGLDAWLSQKSQPPPVVLHPTPKPAEKPEQPAGKPAQPPKETPKESAPKPEAAKPQQEPEQKPAEPEKKTESQKQTDEKREPKKEVRKKPVKTVKKKAVKPLKSYAFQIGAFRYKENAYRMASRARKLGFKAVVVKRGELYRVVVYARASSYREALAQVKRYFKEVLPVRG